MFYQPHRIATRGQPSIPGNWEGLDANMPVLVNLVASAPTSGYIATLFLNIIQLFAARGSAAVSRGSAPGVVRRLRHR